MPPASPPDSFQPGDPRLIVRWAQRYAKSRTISFLVQWVFIVAMVSAIGLAAALTNTAYRAGNMGLFSIAVASMVLAMIALMWFSISPWGGELIARITQWLYGEEGYVAYLEDQRSPATPWWLTGLGGGLVAYHLLGALVVSFNYRWLIYMQPYSAAYMVPFLIVMIVYQRLGFWAWIWPILYGLHALVILAVPAARISGQWQMLNMILPVFGYGLVAILAGHIYSRYALYKLKSLARTGLDGMPPGDETHPEEDADEDSAR